MATEELQAYTTGIDEPIESIITNMPEPMNEEQSQVPDETGNQNVFNKIFGVPNVNVNVKPALNNQVYLYTILVFIMALTIIIYATRKKPTSQRR